ncbi:late promoter transcriptional regulator [Acinetobacter phage ZZ1]|uniref:Late transcription coactivator n=1 Tax=Acinetobacter phage ZZ1 TaxID=1049283 RepID=W0B0Q1_9CAUD|nr:late promoter transcriptional regulator [Acinetobacter phage ZZ1]AHE63435.1 late promoter transcription accessory protein [Acinetobacter phage ZZ1]
MHCLLTEETPVTGNPTKLVAEAYDKQTTAAEIDDLVATGLSVLEAVTWWMEERSIPESQFARYIPEAVIEQLKLEVIEDNILKPSLTKQNTHSTLDFLYG